MSYLYHYPTPTNAYNTKSANTTAAANTPMSPGAATHRVSDCSSATGLHHQSNDSPGSVMKFCESFGVKTSISNF